MTGDGMQAQGLSVAGFIVGALCILMWLAIVPSLTGPNGSDAAGNGLAHAVTALATVVLWVALAVLAIIAVVNGGVPWFAASAALILIPLSGFVAIQAVDLLAYPGRPPYLWPIVIPALIPPLIVGFFLWTLLPRFHGIVSANAAGLVTWTAVLLLCVSIVPLMNARADIYDAERKSQADLAALPADAPLWAWVPFLDTSGEEQRHHVLDKMRHSERRQSDAEIMLDRGDFPLRYLGDLDLTPTPAICDKARALLRQQAAKRVPSRPNESPFSDIRVQTNDAIAAMDWLVGYECPCDAESQAWQSVAESYRDPGYVIDRLKELRDLQRLGRKLREDPERFSMLTPKSPLKTWLKFADDSTYRDQALAGARTLDHRTADAVAMLTDERSAWRLVKYLPDLDLEPTRPLCEAALAQVHKDFVGTRRSLPDEQWPYSRFLDRLPPDDPLAALRWLAGHGCDADAALNQAIDLVRVFADLPERAAMIAGLEQLRRKL